VKNSRANSVFQGKRKLLKNSDCKKYIPYSEKFQEKLCFSGQAQVAQKSWMIKNTCSIQWKIPGQTLFSGQAQVAQKSLIVKNMFNTVKNFRGNSVFRASASC